MNPRSYKALVSASALLFLAAVGCTDLTVQPVSTITSVNVFNDPNSYRALLAKVYAGLATSGQQGPAGNPDIAGIDEGFSQYVRLYWESQELPTDEAVLGWGDIGIPELNTQEWSATNVMVQSMYYRVFFQVTLANEFLRQTTDAVLASRNVNSSVRATIQTYRAEARFLRALAYWHGMDLFGSIPMVTENDQLGTTTPPQATRADIYNFVVTELNAIKGLLPAPGLSSYGRATGPAANMLLAEVYLNAGVYAGTPAYGPALTAASAVISSGAYTLDPIYLNMFGADNNNSPEIILAVTSDGNRTQTWGGMTFIVHASVGGSMNSNDYGIDGGWWGLRLKPEAYNRFGAGDRRADFVYKNGQALAVTSISNFNDGYAAPKFRNVTSNGAPGSNRTFVDTDFPMFRLAEAYLIYAEANLRGGGGDATTALGYINALRQRAYGNATGNITAPQLTLQFVLDERGRELLWEGHRRTDLVRYGLFTGGTYVWAWKNGSAAGSASASFRDLYPIPASELVANPGLKQNTGY